MEEQQPWAERAAVRVGSFRAEPGANVPMCYNNIERIMQRHKQHLLVGTVLLALTLRLIYTAYFAEPTYSYDGRVYNSIAQNVLQGDGFGYSPGKSLSWRPPLYPFFLVGLKAIGLGSLQAVRVIQCILGSMTCALLFWLALRVTDSYLVSSLAALGLATHPFAIWYTKLVMTETLFTLLLALMLFLFVVLREESPSYYSALTGTVWGLTALLRPEALVVGATLLLANLILRNWKLRPALRANTFIVVMAVIVIFPWTMRNYIVHGEFCLISSNGGFNLLAGNNPAATGELVPFDIPYETRQQTEAMTEIQRDRAYYQLALQYMRSHPARCLRLAFKKLLILWSVAREVPGHTLYSVYGHLINVLALVGLVSSVRKHWLILMPIILVVLSKSLVHTVFFAAQRFWVPMIPYVLLFASLGVRWVCTTTADGLLRPLCSRRPG